MRILFETNHFYVEIPEHPHVDRKEGGHIRIKPKREVRDRTKLTKLEANNLMRISIAVGKAMWKVLPKQGIKLGKINYQDNGNWAIKENKEYHEHMHIYGRAKDAKKQKYGEALYFPGRETGFYDKFKPFNEKDEEMLRKEIRKNY